MFIQTEPTPNPATLKFLPGEDVMGGKGPLNFTAPDQAFKSPLAEKLFAVEGVDAVFLGSDFIALTKQDGVKWEVIKPHLLGAIMEHYTSGKPVVVDNGDNADASDGEDDEIVSQIKELLDSRVRPAVAQDGGDIIFHTFREGVVYLEMHGACSGCPSSSATLKMGIENMLRYYVPEVQSVEPVYPED